MSESPNRLKGWQVLIVVVLILGMVGGGYTVYKRTTTPTTTNSGLPTGTQLVTVQNGDVVNSVSASGSVAFSNRQKISFNIAGTVGEVDIQVGDTVKAGQTLAKLENVSTTPQQITVAQARINLENAQNDLAKSKVYTDTDISQAKLAVANAQVAVKTAQDNLTKTQIPYTENDINQAKLAVASAQVAVKTAQDNLTKTQTPYTENDINQAKLAVASAQVAVKTAQDNLTKTLTPYTENDINQAKLAVASAQVALKTAQDNYDKAWTKYTQNSTDYNLFLDFQLKQAQLAAAQTNLAQVQQNLADMLASPYLLLVAQKQAQLAAAQTNLAQVQQNLADMLASPDPLLIAQKQAQLTASQASLAQAKQNLADMLAGTDPLTVALRQLQVVNTQEALDNAVKAVTDAQNTTIKAPFDGVVNSLSIDVGQKVTAGASVMEIVNTSVAQVSAVVNEIDFASIKVGQPVTLAVDALPNNALTGNVSALSVFGKTTQGVVSYPVTISVDAQPGIQLGEGMSATATIVFSQANNVLVIPNRAIGGTATNPTISLMVNGVLETRPVTLGLSDGTRTQVISGLQAGDRVLQATASTNQGRNTGGGQFGAGGDIPGGGQIFRAVGGG